MSLEIIKHLTSDIKTRLASLQKSSSPLEQKLFDYYNNPANFPSSITVFQLQNALAVTTITTINKQPYTEILTLDGTIEDLTLILNEIISKEKLVNSNGIFTKAIKKSSDLNTLLKAKKFITFQNIYGSSLSELAAKTSNRTKVTSIRFSSKNKHQYKALFSELLLEYDTLTNSNLNKTLNHPVYPIFIKNSRSQRIRITYFLEDLLKQYSKWYAFLLFKDDTPLGFIKAKLPPKDASCYYELYLKPEYYSKYAETALGILTDALSNQTDYISQYVPVQDTKSISSHERWFNKLLGSTYSSL